MTIVSCTVQATQGRASKREKLARLVDAIDVMRYKAGTDERVARVKVCAHTALVPVHICIYIDISVAKHATKFMRIKHI